MEAIKQTRWISSRPWYSHPFTFVPLWLWSFAIMFEGFPRLPLSIEVAIASCVLAVVLSGMRLWQKRLTIAFTIYSLFPLVLLPIFDEISTIYKTPFIMLCAVILTLGGMIAQQRRVNQLGRGAILLVAAVVTLALAWHAAFNFWAMVSSLGYSSCVPDAQGCPPLTGQVPPWWALFFGLSFL